MWGRVGGGSQAQKRWIRRVMLKKQHLCEMCRMLLGSRGLRRGRRRRFALALRGNVEVEPRLHVCVQLKPTDAPLHSLLCLSSAALHRISPPSLIFPRPQSNLFVYACLPPSLFSLPLTLCHTLVLTHHRTPSSLFLSSHHLVGPLDDVSQFNQIFLKRKKRSNG